jgi:hypothetical protein
VATGSDRIVANLVGLDPERMVEHRERRRLAPEHDEEHDPRVRARRRGVEEVGIVELVLGELGCDDRRRPLELRELRAHEAVLEQRDDDHVDERERARDDGDERERELRADAARPAHTSRKR